ncbi:FecR family protein [Steroidobacter sp.]|uniref:FecR family protein n=1 Tax=Steroidobacter sp. TaxID=1978227 RepID=UPI001A3DFACF|nr:FecR domain-containing protein [Steroidobacter sp.]MBL8266264.1 FecR domain-containing protein [Steroidobacter sp.]
MSELHRIPSVEDAEREAGDWIARLQADDASPEDYARFDEWRRASPRHARAYDELMGTWRDFTTAGRTVRAVSFGNAMQAATQLRRRRTGAFAAAAAVACLAVLLSWWQWRTPSTFETDIGQQASISLSDGSQLQLNSNSAVRVIYSDASRIIRLDRGEAFFTVAHDSARPFWVVADHAWVRAVGTAFNVYRRESDVRVTVSEGRVRVVTATALGDAPSDGAMAQLPASQLDAGQQADLRGAITHMRALPTAELTREVSWRSGTAYFENRPLYEVVAELERYTPLQIELSDATRELPIGGTFQTNSQGVETLLTMLQDGFGLQVRRDGDQTVHVN